MFQMVLLQDGGSSLDLCPSDSGAPRHFAMDTEVSNSDLGDLGVVIITAETPLLFPDDYRTPHFPQLKPGNLP